MFKRIQTKLAAIFVVTVCVTIGALFIVLETGQHEAQKSALIESLNELADLQANALSRPVWELDGEEIENLVRVLAGHPDVRAVVVLEPQGDILAEERQDVAEADPTAFLVTRDITHLTPAGPEPVAQLALTYSLARIQKEWISRLQADFLTLVAIAAVLLGVTLIATRQIVSRPLQDLIQSMERQKETGQRETVSLRTDDEIGTLVESFNELTASTEQAARAAEQKSELLNTVLENLSEGLTMVDQDMKLLTFNRRYLELTGLPEDLVQEGVSYTDILRYAAETGTYGDGMPEDLVQSRLESFHNVDGRPIRRLRPDGGLTEMRRRQLEDGRIVTTHVDITELHETQEALQDAKENAEKMSGAKSDFLALMSHELRTPLNSIIGFSEVLAHEVFGKMGSQKYVEYASHIHGSGRHLLALINDILDLSKVESGAFELNEEVFDIDDLLEFCITMIKPRARKQSVVLSVDAAPNMPKLFADLRAVRQIVLNLLSNAVKFTPAGGQVSVTAGLLNNGEVVISVSDTGIGIAEADIMRVLEPFGQAREGQWTAHEGTGLGLPLARRLAEMHEGRLALESRVDVGTTVSLFLPRSRVNSTQSDGAAPGVGDATGKATTA